MQTRNCCSFFAKNSTFVKVFVQPILMSRFFFFGFLSQEEESILKVLMSFL